MAAAKTEISGRRPRNSDGTSYTRRAGAIAAPLLGTTVRDAADGTDAPSATSGNQAWAGTAPSLNATPVMVSANPTNSNGDSPLPNLRDAEISASGAPQQTKHQGDTGDQRRIRQGTREAFHASFDRLRPVAVPCSERIARNRRQQHRDG